MKKLITLLIICMPLLSGCMVYGEGETTGYIYAVDDGILWDKVWYKSSVDSSESDCYLIQEDSRLKDELRKIGDVKVKLKYKRHFSTLALCPEGTTTSDEIISYEVIED